MKRCALVVVAILIAGSLAAETITVATLNVWSGLTYQGAFSVGEYEDSATREFRFDLITKGLSQVNPDLITLQEANPLPAYASEMAAAVNLDVVSDVRQGGVRIGSVGLPANLREGEVILAGRDRALTYVATKELAGPSAGNVASFQLGDSSQVVATSIEAEGRTVHVFTTRWTPSPQASRTRLVGLVDDYLAGNIDGDELSRLMNEAVNGSERRKEEARETVIFINEIAGEEPVILTGSLFALPDSEEIKILRDAGFVDVWTAVGRGAGYTFDATNNANIIAHDLAEYENERVRYDYIFVRGSGITARSASVILNRPTYGVNASSHYGVLAEIRIDR